MTTPLCAELERVNALVETRADLGAALTFIRKHRGQLLHAWSGCNWRYACPNPPFFWVQQLRAAEAALSEALALPGLTALGRYTQAQATYQGAFGLADNQPEPRYMMAVAQWRLLVAAAREAPCNPAGAATRWVIRAHADGPPHWGQTLCTPTARPRLGEREFSDRSMCEYALFGSQPQSTMYTYNTLCGPWGCGQMTGGVPRAAVNNAHPFGKW
jgi:hypothetical protein